MNQPLQKDIPRIVPDSATQYYEDEISLIDLWLVLLRHKKTFWSVLALCGLSGLLFALIVPTKYSYTTSIEIGSRVQEKDVIAPIEEPQTVLAKLQESYIPLAMNEYLQSDAGHDSFDIKARVPKGSQIIVLESKGAEKGATDHLSLQQNVVDKIKQDHQYIVDIIRKEVEANLNMARNKLNGLEDDALLITAREKRVNDLERLLKQRLEDTKKELANAQSTRQRAVKEATTATKAMTLLLLDSEIDKQRVRVSDLQERLKVDIADKRDEFVKQLSDNKRQQSNQSQQISRLETQLANLRETRAIVPPMQSSNAVGISAPIVVLLSVVIGTMLGLFSAFFAEFLVKVKQQSQLQTKA